MRRLVYQASIDVDTALRGLEEAQAAAVKSPTVRQQISAVVQAVESVQADVENLNDQVSRMRRLV